MGVMIHLGYKNSTGGGVPSPVDPHTPDAVWPLDEWAALLPLLASYGVTVALCPPLTKGATLGAGYDIRDNFDIGSKMWGGRMETRYGSVETAMRFFAQARAVGMQGYVNVVDHHLDGDGGNEIYLYLGADGETKNGRFPKDKHCFTSVWPNPDGVPDSSTDWAFGREFLWRSGTYGDGLGANGPGYVQRGLTEALDWQTRRLGVDGFFLDDVKGTNAPFVAHLLSHGAQVGKVAFGEYSDGQTYNLMRWMSSVGNLCGVMDFPLKYKMNNVLNNAGHADMRQLLSEGVLWSNPLLAVTFLDNADSDLSSPVIWNKLLGYAMLLTFPGYPMLFGKDLYTRPGCYGLLKPVLNLCFIHETMAKGDLFWRALDYNHQIYERMGDASTSGLLAGVNNKPGSFANPADWTPVRVQCKWRNTHLHDYTGHSLDQWSDDQGMVTIWLPPNDNGLGYVVFAPYGAQYKTQLVPGSITQTFFGADDLDTAAARDGTLVLGRIMAAKGSPLVTTVRIPDAAPNARVAVSVVAADGTVVTSSAAPTDGLYTVALECSGLSIIGVPVEVDIQYEAPALPIVRI